MFICVTIQFLYSISPLHWARMCDQATLKNQLSTKASCPIDFGTAIVFLLLALDPKTTPSPWPVNGSSPAHSFGNSG